MKSLIFLLLISQTEDQCNEKLRLLKKEDPGAFALIMKIRELSKKNRIRIEKNFKILTGKIER